MDKAISEQQAACSLIKHLHVVGVLSTAQLEQGFLKVHSQMGDLALDAPTAPKVLANFVQFSVDQGLLPVDFNMA